MRVAALAAMAAVTSACDLTSSVEIEPEDVIVVEAYLRPDGALQRAFLYRTVPGLDAGLQVDGATVELVGPNRAGFEQRGALTPAGDDRVCADFTDVQLGSCYVGFFAPVPGETYTMRVTTDDGRRLTGTTTLPGEFDVRHPTGDSCVLADTASLELVWTQSEGARSYIIQGTLTGLAPGLADRGVADPPDELELTGLAVGQADTTLVFPGELGVFDRFDLDRDVAVALQQGLPTGASADIVIAAGDQNYVNWVRGGSFNPSGQVRVPSITGDGTGVFGSLVTRRLTILSGTPGYPACQ